MALPYHVKPEPVNPVKAEKVEKVEHDPNVGAFGALDAHQGGIMQYLAHQSPDRGTRSYQKFQSVEEIEVATIISSSFLSLTFR